MTIIRFIASTSLIIILAACNDGDFRSGFGLDDDTADIVNDPITTPPIIQSISDAPAQIYTVNSPILTLTFPYTTDGSSLSSCTGSLPAGLTVAVTSDGNTCEITGTPSVEQTASPHTITATYPGGSDTASVDITVRGRVSLNLAFAPTKLFQFSWNAVLGVDHYKLVENPDGVSGFSTVRKITAGTEAYEHQVPLYARVNARYTLEACFSSDDTDCHSSSLVNVTDEVVQSIGYFKGSNTEAYDSFGFSVALSADGNTLAVGAAQEDSASSGINSTTNNLLPDSGAVYLFRNVSGRWSQQAYIKASNPGVRDCFGCVISLSADGNRLAVSASRDDSSTTGINSTADDLAKDSGAVYVFQYASGNWSQQAYIKSSNAEASDVFGTSVSLSADGNTLAVGAFGEDSSTTGINSIANNLADLSGAVYLFRYINGSWSQSTYIKASNTEATDVFGLSVALSADGYTLAVGTRREDSATTGINSTPDNLAMDSGAVYLFRNTSGNWSQQAYIKASNTGEKDAFGLSIALSADGNTLAVGAYAEDSATTGINSTPDNLASHSGAAYVYRYASGNWSQQAYIKSLNAGVSQAFGRSVALSADGNRLAVGAFWEDSAGIGINSTSDDFSYMSGAAYVFHYAAGDWWQQAYVKASNTGRNDHFGSAVALSADGNTLAVGARQEGSSTTGINSTPDDLAIDSGAVYLY